MFVDRNFKFMGVMRFTGGHLVWMTVWSSIPISLYILKGWTGLAIPWLPISLVGTAVAFYVGFKNNSSYDRLWEARKIWGAIVNDSRSWGIGVKHFITHTFAQDNTAELHPIHQRMIYRHIAWLYTLRKQLLVPTSWEHVNGSKMVSKVNQKRKQSFGVGLLNEGEYSEYMKEFLSGADLAHAMKSKNGATQLIELQAADLKQLRDEGLIDDFRHMELQKLLTQFYTHQGKAERIKKFPLPRQYASMSYYFVAIFIVLLPFGMLDVFSTLKGSLIWLALPASVVVSWVFLMMELVGDYSENPFEGLSNDIPMMSLSRTIEIDLREMLGEEELPAPIEAVRNVLM